MSGENETKLAAMKDMSPIFNTEGTTEEGKNVKNRMVYQRKGRLQIEKELRPME